MKLKSIALTLAVLFGTFPAFAAEPQKGTEEEIFIEEVKETTPAETSADQAEEPAAK